MKHCVLMILLYLVMVETGLTNTGEEQHKQGIVAGHLAQNDFPEPVFPLAPESLCRLFEDQEA